MPTLMKEKKARAKRRAYRVRSRINGTVEVPRLSVFRSLKHISAQIIDDVNGKTLVSASDKEIKEKGKPHEIAKKVGVLLAEKANVIGIKAVIFDRGRYRYHGRIAALAEGVREGEIKF